MKMPRRSKKGIFAQLLNRRSPRGKIFTFDAWRNAVKYHGNGVAAVVLNHGGHLCFSSRCTQRSAHHR
ncbi:hypothetical protein CE153_03440 [Bifidobacterium sp. N4G05]|nr:hypothetical protein CE153_03440 [Bifidobacterium sp. N4G05]